MRGEPKVEEGAREFRSDFFEFGTAVEGQRGGGGGGGHSGGGVGGGSGGWLVG